MRSIVPIAVLVTMLLGAARADEHGLSATTQPFNDRFTERVPVGGRNLVGVVATPTADLPSGIGLINGRLTLPATTAGAVCVQARTQDGRYEAENTYTPLGASLLPQALDWPSAYLTVLKTVPLRQVAALTTVGACGTSASVVIPTGMDGAASAESRFLQVLVNTRGATTSAVLRNPAADKPTLARVRCTRLEDGARVAYDARCALGPITARGELELRIEQEGRDGLSLEVVAKVSVRTGDQLP